MIAGFNGWFQCCCQVKGMLLIFRLDPLNSQNALQRGAACF